jgi:hypothetical protein
MNKVTGKVLLHETGVGIPNLVVTVYDVDSNTLPEDAIQSKQTSLINFWEQLQGNRLGSILSNQDGTFVLEYEDKELKEERPDLLLFVTAPEGPGVDGCSPVLHVSGGIRQNAGRIESYLVRLTADQLTKAGIDVPSVLTQGTEPAKSRVQRLKQAQNTTENIFRFLQIRAAAGSDKPPIELVSDTPFAKEFAGVKPDEQKPLSIRFLAQQPPVGSAPSAAANLLLDKLASVTARDGSVGDLHAALNIPQDQLSSIHRQSSDVLLATKFASTGTRNLLQAERLFRATNLLLNVSPSDRENKLTDYLRRPLALPASFGPSVVPVREHAPSSPKSTRAKTPVKYADSEALDETAIYRALEEIAAASRPDLMHLPAASEGDSDAPSDTAPFTLNDRGLRRLSSNTHHVLSELELDVTSMSLDTLVQGLEAEVAFRANRLAERRRGPMPGPQTSQEPLPYIRDVGVADLLVVKQHLKAYERVDIAHVENIISGEKKSRNHRALERTEDTITTEREAIHERETELETAERFELNRETARTVKRDQQFGFGLTLSGKYGPTVEFSSNLQAIVNTSTDESARSATRYAKDIVERSLERVVERVREEQVRRVVREQEETNLHELENKTSEYITGVYQFLEKVYESQVFNYGIRQMFDFMVPEPASYLWHLEKNETELNLPTPPPKLEIVVPSASAINPSNYLSFAATFGADGIEPPPQIYIKSATSLVHGADASDEGEEGQPRSVVDKEIPVPDGYRPFRALIRPLALTDDDMTIGITIGHMR